MKQILKKQSNDAVEKRKLSFQKMLWSFSEREGGYIIAKMKGYNWDFKYKRPIKKDTDRSISCNQTGVNNRWWQRTQSCSVTSSKFVIIFSNSVLYKNIFWQSSHYH